MFDRFEQYQIIDPVGADPHFREAGLVMKYHPLGQELQLLYNFDRLLSITKNTAPFLHTLPPCGEYEVTLGFGHVQRSESVPNKNLGSISDPALAKYDLSKLALPGTKIPTLLIFMQKEFSESRVMTGVQFLEGLFAQEMPISSEDRRRLDKDSFKIFCQLLLRVAM